MASCLLHLEAEEVGVIVCVCLWAPFSSINAFGLGLGCVCECEERPLEFA